MYGMAHQQRKSMYQSLSNIFDSYLLPIERRLVQTLAIATQYLVHLHLLLLHV
jgi:hypothetical protein